MNIPITGVLLIPLGLIVTFLPWRYCLMALMIFAMMSPAAVVNVGSFGLEPGYYLAILLICRTATEIIFDGFKFDASVLARLWPVLYFMILCFVVLFIALCFFHGIETLPGTAGFKSAAAQPFSLQRENMTQLAYLILNVVLVYALGRQGAQRDIQAWLRAWDTAVVCGLCFSVAVCLWQLANLYSGLPFPNSFFFSGPLSTRGSGQPIYGLFRINGPFEEPSTLGYAFTGFLLFAWLRYRVYPTAFSIFMIAGSIFCMLVSTSTTAFFGLFLFGCIAVYQAVTGRIRLFRKNLKFTRGEIFAFGAIAIGLLGAAVAVADNWQSINLILRDTVFNKTESSSFEGRAFADLMALNIFIQTYGIGIGLGSHKANSLLLTLLSNTGLIGTILFGIFIYSLLRLKFGTLDPRAKETLRRFFSPFQWGLIGLILIHIFSNPNLSTLTLWIEIGALVSLQASLRRSSALAQRASPVRYSNAGLARLYGGGIRPAGRPLES